MHINLMKYLLLFIFLFLSGCAVRDKVTDTVDSYMREPDITPVKKVLSAALPLSYAANLTMAAMKGEVAPNVIVVRSGNDTSTGSFLVHIEVDDAFPLPGNLRASGTIITAGVIVNNRTAIMSAVFTDLNFSEGIFQIHDISTFPVVSDTDLLSGQERLLVVYADMDVNAGSDTLITAGLSPQQTDEELAKYQTMESFDSGVAISENAWIISIDNNHTLSNASDDHYSITGGGQYVEISGSKAEVVQLTMISALMTPACKINPKSGYAFWQNVGVGGTAESPEIGHVFLTFHDACDGKADITVATGVYTSSFGNTMNLRLAQ